MSASVPDPATLFDLEGKVAVVTGGSRGLGREMVLGLARAGADVVIASRKLEACEAVAREIEAMGRRALPLVCHVGDWDSLEGFVERVYHRFARVDVLINNAGMSPTAPSSRDTSEALFDKVVDVNLKGPFRLTALFGPRMVEAGGGSIVMVSSTASLHPDPWTGPYSAAKAGLNALTLAFAKEYGPSVRVNGIVCGPFHTDATASWSRDERVAGHLASRIALGRVGERSEVVGGALYLASDASSYTSGTLLGIHGGTH
jgi:NAD(P)-dependent dehydrogenase (short-subunit alcohol dehydrogenase family)